MRLFGKKGVKPKPMSYSIDINDNEFKITLKGKANKGFFKKVLEITGKLSRKKQLNVDGVKEVIDNKEIDVHPALKKYLTLQLKKPIREIEKQVQQDNPEDDFKIISTRVQKIVSKKIGKNYFIKIKIEGDCSSSK